MFTPLAALIIHCFHDCCQYRLVFLYLIELEKEEAKASDYELAQHTAQGITEMKQIEEDRMRKQKEEDRAYGNDLVCQIDYNRRQREAAEAEHRRLIEKHHEAEQEYQRKITDLLKDSNLTNTHPTRLKLCKHLQGGGLPC